MPGVVDVETGEIIGAKKGTLTYYHEQMHIYYSKSAFGIRASFYLESFLIITVLFLVLPLWFDHIYFKLIPTCSAILFIFLYELEEIVCWIGAYRIRDNKKLPFGIKAVEINDKSAKAKRKKSKKKSIKSDNTKK